MVTSIATREVYGKTLLDLGREDPDLVVLGGDLNKSTFTHLFAQEFPERFFDLGAAEQNIMSIAAGLASCGKTVFASTFAVFGTARPFDQIRVGISQPSLNVKIVCTHAGIITGDDGISAQSIEDVALMCSLPSFTVVVPSDGPETRQAVQAASKAKGPFYIRLSRPPTPVIHSEGFSFHVGRAETVRDGDSLTIIACGIMVATALEVAKTLERDGIQCRVINMATIKPIDQQVITTAATETGAIVTAEEHYIHGGLGSIVAEVVARTCPVPMELIALSGYTESGTPQELIDKYGLSAGHIEQAARKVLSRKQAPTSEDTPRNLASN